MAVQLRVLLNQAQRAEVEQCYFAAREAETRTRFQMVLLAADGKAAGQIGWLVRRSEDLRSLHRASERRSVNRRRLETTKR